MPRASGSRTGQKLKKRKLAAPTAEAGASKGPRMAALEAAAAAAAAAHKVAQGDSEAVRQWLHGVLEQVVLQSRIDEAKADRELRRREMHLATVVACAESLKKRVRPFGQEKASDFRAQRPFFDALAQNVREWEDAYPGDLCLGCKRHLARCECRTQCSRCGHHVPRRVWCVSYFNPQRDICQCEKFGNIMHALMRVA